MCPITARLQVLMLAIILLLIVKGAFAQVQEWSVSCDPKRHTLHMNRVTNVTCDIQGPDKVYSEYMLVIKSERPEIVKADKEIWLKYDFDKKFFAESFNITGQFLGKSKVTVKVQQRDKVNPEAEEVLDIIVVREKRAMDVVFHVSVVVLVSVMYINFGCALNWGELKNNLRKPIGPCIGFIGQFLFMPILSYVIAKLIFPDNIPMQLGMFFTGVSPAGGASNMWTVILGGNIDLSITMTAISTFAAFAMMPLWLFTLGGLIFDEGKIEVPYEMISKYAVTLVIPLFFGFLIKRYLKRVAQFLVRILKGFSSLLLIFIIVFAIISNLYLFKLFSWKIIVAGLGLPWIGYMLAWLLAMAFKQSTKDSLTIAIETGIQNTGISIFLLRFTLEQPEADLTTVIPVAVAIMTPVPLFILYIYQNVKQRCCMKHGKLENSELNSPMSELDNDNNFHTKGPKSISTLS